MIKKITLLTLFFCFVFVLKANAEDNKYSSGTLLALDQKESAVYYIGEDGKKYIFPDSKTYFTWYDDFEKVIKVGVNELDKYEDGGIMPYRSGTKLITHENTANVYAVEPNGVLKRIASAENAEELYGADWPSLVQDVIPGYFSSSYTVGGDLYDKLPTGTLVKEYGRETIYYIYDGLKRKFSSDQSFLDNGFSLDDIKIVQDLSNYDFGRNIEEQEDILLSFNKDKMYKYSDFVLSYKKQSTTGYGWSSASMMTIQFATSTDDGIPIENRPIEIRKAIVRAQPAIFVRYNSDKYNFDFFAPAPNNYHEYFDSPILIDDFKVPLEISAKSNIKVDLREWVIWDKLEDKQIINIHSQTFD